LGKIDGNKFKVFANLFFNYNILTNLREKKMPKQVFLKLSWKPKTSHFIIDFKVVVITFKFDPSSLK
jgi:hypothetical protein